VEGQLYALPLAAVTRIIRMVEITSFPNCPPSVRGLIDVQGTILAVIDLRSVFCLPSRRVEASDQLVIASISNRSVALIVDFVLGVRSFDGVAEGALASFGAAATESGIILIRTPLSLLPNFDPAVIESAAIA